MSETHNTVIVGNKMFRYRKEQYLATDLPLDRHELSVNELFRQLAEYERFKRCVELNLYAPPLDIKPQTESDYKHSFINIVRGLNQLKAKVDE